MAAADGTTRRKIRLDFTSGTPSLAGLNATTAAVNRLGVALRNVSKWGGVFQRSTGFDLTSMGSSAATAATQITTALGKIGAASQKAAGGLSQSFKEATTTFKKSGDQIRSTVDIIKNGFVTTQNVERFAKKSGTSVWDLMSTSSIIKTDYRAQQKALNDAEKKRYQDTLKNMRAGVGSTYVAGSGLANRISVNPYDAGVSQAYALDAQRRAGNAQQILNVQNREREAGILEQAKQDAEVAKRRQQKWSHVADEQVRRTRESVAGLVGTPLDRQRGAIAAESKLIANLTRMANNAQAGADLQQKLNGEIKAANLRIARAYGRIGNAGGLPRGSSTWGALWGGESGWLDRGLRGWTPMGFTKNMLTAGGWMMAVTAPMKALQLAGHSIGRSGEMELQTARLTQVFRGAGGTAEQLTDDVLKLAAAEGRGADEAIQAAVAWSRLGLSRRQVAEATRVSLVAANVAEMTAAETTQHLSAVTAAYGLEVSDLDAALGMLNQTSNTYRVTVKDILQGISRVSGVAKQAGMSLSELQAIIGVSVQQTGQSGTNMANALKTILVRMNRPDVQEFLGQRYNINSTGSSEDLRKVWQTYSSLNEEQQRDIQLKIGSATQASRFRAIMESYPEKIRAEMNSLRNLNSAQKENILITNTMVAARARLGSSWDRLVNSRVMTGIVGGAFNSLTSSIDATTNLFSGGRRNRRGSNMFYDADKSSWLQYANFPWKWASQGINAGFGMYYGAMSRIAPKYDWQTAWRNSYPNIAAEWWRDTTLSSQGWSNTPTSQKDKMAEELRMLNELRAKGESARVKESWMKSLGSSWGSLNPEVRDRVIKSLGGVMSASSLQRLKESPGSALGIFGQEEEVARLRRLAVAESDKRITDSKIATLRAKQDKTPEEEAHLNDLLRERDGIINDIVEETTTWAEKEERVLPVLIKQRAELEDIADTIRDMGFSHVIGEAAVLREQIMSLNAILRTPGLADKASQELTQELNQRKAMLSYLQSPGAMARGMMTMGRGVARDMAQTELGGFGVGLTEGEQLLDRRVSIERELGRYKDASKMTANDLQRAQVFSNALLETQYSIQARIHQVERERVQLGKEANREFQRSLIGSSPSQLLSKLATFQLNKQNGGKWSAGEFFSLSGESQRDIWGMMGGDRMADLNRESNALRGAGTTVVGMQDLAVRLQHNSDVYAAASAAIAAAMAALPDRMQASFDAVMSKYLKPGDAPTNAPTASAPPNFTPGGGSFRGNGAGGSWG